MNAMKINRVAVPFHQNLRAEDGNHPTTPWNDLCDEVLVPVGSLLAVFLLCAAVIWLA